MKPAAVSEVRSIAADSERTSAAKADMPETEVRVKQCAGVLSAGGCSARLQRKGLRVCAATENGRLCPGRPTH